ncbi:MAG: tRNA epoxyqueuosine(34) reductase QueG [Armatimonas sp.]
MDFEEKIRAFALTLFDDVRFTSVEPPGHPEYVRAWLAAGMHGELGYLDGPRAELRAGRQDDARLVDNAQTTIVVALSYSNPAEKDGPIARYARRPDYHNVFWEKLNTLKDWLAAEFPGTHSRGFCDSGPLRERELAARAGLGWQGKHTNLISLDLGNWFFLGALITTLPLTPDAPFTENHCGNCTRCLAVCPTGALIAPLALDARRCISYLTIEQKGAIPLELRPLMGDHVFGCDDCLAVCPHNAHARIGHEAKLAAQEFPDLLGLLEATKDDTTFKALFAGTPMLRPKREGFRRNVCVALGNTGGPEAIPALQEVLATDPSELVREHAAWALEQLTQALF